MIPVYHHSNPSQCRIKGWQGLRWIVKYYLAHVHVALKKGHCTVEKKKSSTVFISNILTGLFSAMLQDTVKLARNKIAMNIHLPESSEGGVTL